MKKCIVLLILLQFSFSSCTFTSIETLIRREVSQKSIFQSDRGEVEDIIGVTFSSFYNYILNGNRYSGVYYDRYVFLFQNNLLINIVEYGEMERIWKDEFVALEDVLPYRDNLLVVHQKISSLPLYASKIEDRKGGLTPTDISDGLAASLMLVFSIPIIPIVIYESSKEPAGVKINWESEIVGYSYDSSVQKLGYPMSERIYEDGSKMLSYKQQYFWIPHYVGIKNDQVLWVLHKSFELNNN